MNMTKYETANSWLSGMHEEGKGVSIVLCQALERLMKEEKITFPEAYKKLESQNRISCENGNFGLTAAE